MKPPEAFPVLSCAGAKTDLHRNQNSDIHQFKCLNRRLPGGARILPRYQGTIAGEAPQWAILPDNIPFVLANLPAKC